MSNTKLALLHLPFLIVLIWLALITEGTGGTGDTLLHFYYAQASWHEPIHFFNLWAKPLFTLFASPFAQFGFDGIQVFNAICGTGAVFLASLCAKNLGKGFYYLLPLLAFIAPGFHSYLFSGLTEPFSALVLIAVVYLLLKNQKSRGGVFTGFFSALLPQRSTGTAYRFTGLWNHSKALSLLTIAFGGHYFVRCGWQYLAWQFVLD